MLTELIWGRFSRALMMKSRERTANSLILHSFTHLTTISHAGAARGAPVLPPSVPGDPKKAQNMPPALTTRLLDQATTNVAERPSLRAASREYRVSARG